MADETKRTISQLITAERTTASDLFEIASPNSVMESGYVSRKVSASEIANLINRDLQYSDLNSSDKHIIGAINEIIENIDDLELFKFPNATIIGTPTINNGQISGFSQTSYLQFPFLMDFQGRHFAINMEFTTAADVTNQQNIFDSDFGLAFAIRSAKFVIAVSSNGTSWNIGEGVGTHTVLPNTTYRVQLAWDGTAYKLSYSVNGGESYTEDISLASTASPFPKQVYIGVGENYASVLNFFKGIINLNYASLYVADSLVWQGMDDVGLASRLATDLSNIDAAGEQRIKDIAGGGGGGDVTKAYVDAQDANLQTQITNNKDRIDVLEKMSKGILYDFVSQTVEGIQNIPKGSHLADIQKLEGKSIVWNQKLIIRNSQTIEGITLTSNGDGSYTVSGTANTTVWLNIGTFTTVVGHTYYLKGCPKGGSTSTYRLHNDNGGLYDIGDGSLAVATAEKRIYISLLGGATADNLVFKPQLFDLTQMFGAGNEPTIEQFEAMFPNDYYPYSEPTLQSVDNTKMIVKGNYWIQLEEGEVATDYAPYSETDYPLTFAGKSAGTVRDELDLVNKKYIQRVGVVDLGSLDWKYNANYFTVPIFYVNIPTAKDDTSAIMAKYSETTDSPSTIVVSVPDKTHTKIINIKYMYIHDSVYTDVNSFKNSLNGQELYYELDEPIITDVSEVIDSFDVEGNGSIEFDSSIPVKNTIEYLRYLNEV